MAGNLLVDQTQRNFKELIWFDFVILKNYKLQITNYKLQITNYKLQITNYKFQVTDYQKSKTKKSMPI